MVFAKPPLVKETAPLEIQVPEFHSKVLSCGLKVIFLKNTEMPLVEAHFLTPGGTVLDPEGKEGLVGLMNASLRNGGAGKLTAEAFDEALENRAASMGASADTEAFSAEFKCLSKDLPEVLGLFADMLRSPQFDPKRLESAKADILDSLNRLTDIPDDLSRVLFYKSLLGHSPYGRWASPQSLSQVTREDVAGFFQKHYGPQGAVLSLTGDFDEEKVTGQLEALFSGWKGQGGRPSLEDAQPMGPAIYFYPKEVSQVFIRWGVPGIKRHDPQDIPLQVANYILGGSGFTSRLMRDIRSNRGLAYFVDSVTMPYNIRGVFEVVGGTRPDSVKEYLTEMFQLTGEYSKQGPTDQELAEAQRSLIEEYAYNFESPFGLAAYKASLDFNGYPENYLETYRQKVKAVTREQAASAANSILSQKDWVLVVCGPESYQDKEGNRVLLEKELATFGKVVRVKELFESLENKP